MSTLLPQINSHSQLTVSCSVQICLLQLGNVPCRVHALMLCVWWQAGSEAAEGEQGLLSRAKQWLQGLVPPPPPAAASATAGGNGSGPVAERVAALTGAHCT